MEGFFSSPPPALLLLGAEGIPELAALAELVNMPPVGALGVLPEALPLGPNNADSLALELLSAAPAKLVEEVDFWIVLLASTPGAAV